MKTNPLLSSWWSAPFSRVLCWMAACAFLLTDSRAQDLLAAMPGMAAADVVTAGQTSQEIQLMFREPEVNVATLGDGDITVTGPQGYVQRGALVSVAVSPAVDPAGGIIAPFPGLVATYRISSGREGGWAAAQNGAYSVFLNAGEVQRSGDGFYPPGLLGGFAVKIGIAPPPDTASLTVNATHPAAVTAQVVVALERCYAIVSQTVTREGNRFVLSATSLPTPCPPPPDDVIIDEVHRVALDYALGAPAPGHYSAVFLLNGTKLAAREFDIAAMPPVPAEAKIAVDAADPAQVSAAVTVQFGDHYRIASQAVRRDGNRITLIAEPEGPLPLMAPLPPQPITVRYDLGALPPGVYGCTFVMRDKAYAATEFKVSGDIEPPATTVALRVDTSGPAVSLVAVVDFADPYMVITEPGTPRQDGAGFVIDATAARAEFLVEPDGAPVTLTYSFGMLEPGAYSLVYQINGSILARAAFVIAGPPPPVVPHVAFIAIREGDAAHAAEVGIILDRPGRQVLEWGEVTRTENAFAVEIVVGAGSATDPAEPVDPVLPGAWPDGVEIGADGDPLIGGFPVRLVSHTYPLGVLSAGAYRFTVTSGGKPVASQPFSVRGSGPSATLAAEDIVSAGAVEQHFRVAFADPDGLDHDSIQAAAVTITGPDGFSAAARLTEYASTDDDPSTSGLAIYALPAPGGQWDARDNGRYRISIDAAAVTDLGGDRLAHPGLGSFDVRITPDLPGDEVTITARMTDSGEWVADVSVNVPHVTILDWGTLITHGSVLVALADAEALPVDDITPGAAPETTHTYSLGTLSPGPYRFLFKTDLGHCGQAVIHVPGLPRDPLIAWMERMQIAGAPGDAGNADAFRQFAFALQPDAGLPDLTPALVPGADGRPHLGLRYRRLLGAVDVDYVLQGSTDMLTWHDAGDAAEILDREPDIDGTESVHVCLRAALADTPVRYLRIVARRTGE